MHLDFPGIAKAHKAQGLGEEGGSRRDSCAHTWHFPSRYKAFSQQWHVQNKKISRYLECPLPYNLCFIFSCCPDILNLFCLKTPQGGERTEDGHVIEGHSLH